MKTCSLKSSWLVCFAVQWGILLLPFSILAQTVYEQLKVISPIPTPNDIIHLVHLNGKFIGTTNIAGVIVSSDDGITWSSHQTGYAWGIGDVAYGNGIYIARGQFGGPAFYSSDLENWTEISSNDLPRDGGNVYFHDGLFYFGGMQTKTNEEVVARYGIITTADGLTFNNVEVPAEDVIEDILFANGQFIAVGRDLEIMTSLDGLNWTLRPTGAALEGSARFLLNVNYINSLYVVTGREATILTSPDGIAWTHREFTEGNFQFSDSWHDGTTYYFPGPSLRLWTTTDFVAWTDLQIPYEFFDTLNTIEHAEGITVVAGRDGLIFTSTDQVTWTSRRTGFSDNIRSLVYGEGLFVANLYEDLIHSVDGISWSSSSSPGLSNNWRRVLYEGGQFVAMTGRGEWSLSADGKTWSALSEDPNEGFGLEAFKFLNEKWFLVGYDGVLRSSDSLVNVSDWDVHDIPAADVFFNIGYGNGVYVAIGRPGAIYTSEDGVNWISRESGTTNDLHSIAYGNGKFVILGGVRTGLTSTDGVNWTSDGQQGNPNASIGLAYKDGQFITHATSGRVFISSDGLVWDLVRTSSGGTIYETAQSDEHLVAVGNHGLVLQAELPPKKNLRVQVEGQGVVDVSPDVSTYPHLAKVTLTATAHQDFAFTQWSGDVSSDDNPLILEMDADKTITAEFVLSVTGYRLWVYQHFNEAEREDEEISGAQADSDGDRLSNLEEYLLGTAPKTPDIGLGVQMGTVEIDGQSYLTISFNRSKNVSGVTQTVEVGDDLDSWFSGPTYSEEYEVVDNGDGTESVTMRLLDPIGSLPSWFARMVFEEL